MTKLADLKEGDCFISPIHGGPVVRASNPPGGLPYKWAWSRLGCYYQKPKEAAVYEKTDLTLIEHYSTHPTPTPLLPVAKKEPEKRWIKDTEVRNGDRFWGFQRKGGSPCTSPYQEGAPVVFQGNLITNAQSNGIHRVREGSDVSCLVSRENWDEKLRQASKPFSFSERQPVAFVQNMIPGDSLNGVLLSEIVQRYELGMREERVEIGPNGKKRIRMRKGFEVVRFENDGPAGGLGHIQFLAAQAEFTRLVKIKAAEARKAEKESVKVERDTDYWNE